MRERHLPIYEIEGQLLETLIAHKRLVLSAPTGSGKSTQVPQILLDGGLLGAGQVAVLQPRRMPTRLLASWVAQSRGVTLGGEVGYQMRLDSMVSGATRIRYVTEGLLLRQMLAEPELKGVSAILFDEFHERHLYGDITLARALQIQASTRPDLIVIVMSATLEVASVEKYLQPCAVLASKGRAYPVKVEYLTMPAGNTPVWDLAVKELRRLSQEHSHGDALIFMPGAYEINRTVQRARDTMGQEFVVLPLHGALAAADQDAAVARYDKRKIVVATNVAETSLTIDGVRLVIDSGLARMPRFDPFRGINTLLIEKISRSAADQRTGRAGRTAAGHCLRLWTAHEQGGRAAQEIPEVRRLDLAEVILTLKSGGIDDVKNFRWLEPPDPRAIERAELLLAELGALDGVRGAITPLGRRMLAFPVHPRYARMLLAAHDNGCVRTAALVAALTQGRDLLLRRQGKQTEASTDKSPDNEDDESDFFRLMQSWREAEGSGFNVARCQRIGVHAQAAHQVVPLFEQFIRIASQEGLDASDKPFNKTALQRCLLVAFPDHLAKRLDAASQRCELVYGRRGLLARESVVKAPLLVVAEIRELESGSSKDRNLNVILSLATAVKEEWLHELFPQGFKETRAVVYDPALRRVVARVETRFRDLLLKERAGDQPPALEAAAVLTREVVAGRLILEHWDASVEQWILRVNRLCEWMPELALPAIGEADKTVMIEHVCHGACSYHEIKNRPVLPVVRSWLSRQQQVWLDEYAPEQIHLPKGRRVKVVYSTDRPPTIAARIQDLYGIADSLWIAGRRVAVRIEVLAPSNRPVQVTENLAAFWRDTYPQLKQRLQRRYPKHEWR